MSCPPLTLKTANGSVRVTYPTEIIFPNGSLSRNGSRVTYTPAGGGGDVVGASSATDEAIARFDSATGKLIQNSVVIITDTGNMSGVRKLTIAPAANAPGVTISGYSLTGSNAQSLIDLAGTWNTSGVPTLIKANVTDTASGDSAALLDLLVGGVSKFKVNKHGLATFDTASLANATQISNGNGGLTLKVDPGIAKIDVSAPSFEITQPGAPVGTGKFRLAGASFSIGEVPSDGFIDFNVDTSIFRIGVGGRTLKLGDSDGQGNGTLIVVDDLNPKLLFTGQPSVFDLDPAGVPAPGALVTMNSTDLGFLPPRMTEAQRDAISSPSEGLIIYNLTSHKLNIFDGTSWVEVTSS